MLRSHVSICGSMLSLVLWGCVPADPPGEDLAPSREHAEDDFPAEGEDPTPPPLPTDDAEDPQAVVPTIDDEVVLTVDLGPVIPCDGMDDFAACFKDYVRVAEALAPPSVDMEACRGEIAEELADLWEEMDWGPLRRRSRPRSCATGSCGPRG